MAWVLYAKNEDGSQKVFWSGTIESQLHVLRMRLNYQGGAVAAHQRHIGSLTDAVRGMLGGSYAVGRARASDVADRIRQEE